MSADSPHSFSVFSTVKQFWGKIFCSGPDLWGNILQVKGYSETG